MHRPSQISSREIGRSKGEHGGNCVCLGGSLHVLHFLVQVFVRTLLFLLCRSQLGNNYLPTTFVASCGAVSLINTWPPSLLSQTSSGGLPLIVQPVSPQDLHHMSATKIPKIPYHELQTKKNFKKSKFRRRQERQTRQKIRRFFDVGRWLILSLLSSHPITSVLNHSPSRK